MQVPPLRYGMTNLELGGVEEGAGYGFGGQVHFIGGGAEGYFAVFVEGEGLVGSLAGLLLGGGEAEPAGVYAEDDLVGAYFDDGVVGAVKAVHGGVGAQEGSPGGPEFAVKRLGHLFTTSLADDFI
jgi:hypothetical protein